MVREYLDRMKNGCIVCNMGHSNTEIDVVSHQLAHICVLFKHELIAHNKASSFRRKTREREQDQSVRK